MRPKWPNVRGELRAPGPVGMLPVAGSRTRGPSRSVTAGRTRGAPRRGPGTGRSSCPPASGACNERGLEQLASEPGEVDGGAHRPRTGEPSKRGVHHRERVEDGLPQVGRPSPVPSPPRGVRAEHLETSVRVDAPFPWLGDRRFAFEGEPRSMGEEVAHRGARRGPAGSSRSSTPSSAAISAARAVRSFVTEAQRRTTSAAPRSPATPSVVTTATAAVGAGHESICSSAFTVGDTSRRRGAPDRLLGIPVRADRRLATPGPCARATACSSRGRRRPWPTALTRPPTPTARRNAVRRGVAGGRLAHRLLVDAERSSSRRCTNERRASPRRHVPLPPAAATRGPASTAAVGTSTWETDGLDDTRKRATGMRPGDFYSRYANPTVRAFEDAVAELEGAEEALAFGRGWGRSPRPCSRCVGR